MDTYKIFKNRLLQISQDVSSFFSNAKSVPEMYDHSFDEWEKTCNDIQEQMAEDIIRVAVVGPIKSGKSTFVNSLFKGDHLKRGAGVVTSIVTRIRRGEHLTANLYFKSWDDVNADMEQAMALFPSGEWRTENDGFDIRKEQDRTELGLALESLNRDLLITHDTRNINSVLLASYLKGYDTVKDILSSDNLTRQYEEDGFSEHKAFAGDDTLAVYLKDIQLEIDSDSIDSNIEIADCQGSDSPNPLHLAMIQDYLLLTNLIIYVISSRTGLRQADIKFLSIIKKMGILDNILFVINVDFGEHESADDLEAVVEKITEELSLIKSEPEIYTLSALFNLFKVKNKNKGLSDKDWMRYTQWVEDKQLSGFSDKETKAFLSFFNHKLTNERYSLLLKNHLERIGVVMSNLEHWISVNKDILARDAYGANEIIDQIKLHQKKMNRIKSMIKSTFEGAVQKLKQQLRNDIDRFFDIRSGSVLKNIIKFIKNHDISYEQYGQNPESSSFSNNLYLAFQDFKQAVDTYMAETTNPEVIHFIREEEKIISEHIESIAGPYDSMIQDALAEYNNSMSNLGIAPIQGNVEKTALPDINSVKGVKGLVLPPAAVFMNYSTTIRTEAVMRLGFYRIVKVMKRVFRRRIKNEKEDMIRALKDGVTRLKRETEKSIVFHFKDYRENLKFQYIFKLVDALSAILYDMLLNRFQAYTADLSKITELIDRKQTDKEQISELLKEMEMNSREISERINSIREEFGELKS
ncbi:MAG: hypothetical protein GY749_48780 [Desulfobacteraceae bacterium]|nr:hypothetical protein [Desulfobacteraceae bacterium]